MHALPGVASALALCAVARADTQVFTIVDDPALDQAIADARAEFLAMKPYVGRLDVVLLVPSSAGDGTVLRGSYQPEALAYPASVVKLAYLAAAMHWCALNGQPYDALDASVGPMIADSSNFQTGVVVDTITGAPNYPATSPDAAFQSWLALRRFTEDYLDARGLLEDQTILHKTYPTNSGAGPTGAEDLAVDLLGGNRMQPKCTASLMLEVVEGAVEPGATAYMRALLTSDRWGGNSVFGFGLPPGAIYENKLGLAYDTLEDVAHVVLPSGQRFVLAAFSDGFQGPEPANPYPYDASLLGVFCELLLERLGWDAGNPAKLVVDDGGPGVLVEGPWSLETDPSVDPDMHGASYRSIASDATGQSSVTWELDVPEDGLYEVCVWSPQKAAATRVRYRVQHDAGTDLVVVDQRHNGGRWVRLGDYGFAAGTGAVVLTNQGQESGKTVLADAVGARLWPGLVADLAAVSVTQGGTQSLSLASGTSAAGKLYGVLGSLSGTSPGLVLGTTHLPLNYDAYTAITIQSPNVPPLVTTFGTLDALGRASAAFSLPSGSPGGLVGLRLHHAYVVIDPVLLTVESASNAAALELVL